jgi:hypothetical protein
MSMAFVMVRVPMRSSRLQVRGEAADAPTTGKAASAHRSFRTSLEPVRADDLTSSSAPSGLAVRVGVRQPDDDVPVTPAPTAPSIERMIPRWS